MNDNNKKAAKTLRQIINSNHPVASRVSIAYFQKLEAKEADTQNLLKVWNF